MSTLDTVRGRHRRPATRKPGRRTSRLDPYPVMRRNRLAHFAVDGWVICKRNLTRTSRMPQLIIFTTVHPILSMLIFVYVFGGAIDAGPDVEYIDFLMPGIFVQTVMFNAIGTGVGLADDIRSGLIDRFHSLPMSRGAVLAGRTLSDLIRNALVIMVMFLVGLAVGFRFGDTTVPAVIAGFGLLLLFAYAFSWVSAAFGLVAGSAEAAQAAGFIWMFPLVFMSSTFVPVETMPGWLQAFAGHQPVTAVIDTTRALFLGGPVAGDLVASSAWTVGILAVFGPLGVRTYRRATTR
jgi:ABC-2 type transport system permease protein/oleandomycin transport system permease protein